MRRHDFDLNPIRAAEDQAELDAPMDHLDPASRSCVGFGDGGVLIPCRRTSDQRSGKIDKETTSAGARVSRRRGMGAYVKVMNKDTVAVVDTKT